MKKELRTLAGYALFLLVTIGVLLQTFVYPEWMRQFILLYQSILLSAGLCSIGIQIVRWHSQLKNKKGRLLILKRFFLPKGLLLGSGAAMITLSIAILAVGLWTHEGQIPPFGLYKQLVTCADYASLISMIALMIYMCEGYQIIEESKYNSFLEKTNA